MSLIVWLPLVKDTQDQGTIPLPSPSYNTLTQQTDGKLGKCYSGCAVYHLNNEILNNEWSVCAWVKSSSWSQYNDIIFCKNVDAGDNCQIYFSIINGAALNIGINNGISSASWAYTFETGTWYHVAATYNGSRYALYVNGEQIKTALLSSTVKTDMNNLCINCRSTNAAGTNQTGDGGKQLNDVRIYDHCLSAAEVKEIAQGLVLHYKLDDIINGIVQDSSGYGNNGEIIGTLTITDNSPRYTSAIFFNSEPYIRKTDFNFITNQWTISCWFKKTSSVTSSHETICGLTRNNGTDANKKFSLYIYNDKVAFVGEGSPHSNITTIDKSVWHHVCATNNQGTYKYYIDNVLKGTYTNSNNFIDCTDFVVGGRANVAGATSISTPWGGNISDIRVYATPLDEAAIKQLYEVGAKVDNKQNLHTYEFNENNSNIFSATPWTGAFDRHNFTTSLFSNYNINGEPQFTVNNTSAGTNYIIITPGIYRYDYTISVNAGNQFYIGFERYDENKTSRSNNACVYIYSTKPSSNIVKQRYTGIIDLSTDGTNPIKYITLRILNGWSGTTSGVTGQATIHNFSLRLVSSISSPKLEKTGDFIMNELKESTKASFYQDGIVEANNLIEY